MSILDKVKAFWDKINQPEIYIKDVYNSDVSISINGEQYKVPGNSDIKVKTIIYANGKELVSDTGYSEVMISGYIKSLDCTKCTVTGDVGNLDCTSAEISGNVMGDVDGTNVKVAGEVHGNIDATNVRR